jgi:hypothetical protein
MKAILTSLSRAATLPAAAILAGLAVPAGPALAAAGAPVGGPHGVSWPGSIPKPGTGNSLVGVSCTSSANCWAVGSYEERVSASADTELNQALHWNGRRWSKVSTPDPAGTTRSDANALDGISCTSRANCWAVGGYSRFSRSGGSGFNMALHWNGRRWSTVATPQPKPGSPAGGRVLYSLSCPSAGDCWAVGFDGILSGSGEVGLTEALHWNGRRWSKAVTPNPGGTAEGDFSGLDSVRCMSARDCWAVGIATTSNGTLHTTLNLALRWNGRRWSQAIIPSPGGSAAGNFSELNGLSCVTASNCWAVGDYSDPADPRVGLSQAMHWNGRRWSVVATPQPAGTAVDVSQPLNDVHCTSAANCWAVGDYRSIVGNAQSTLNQALHWDGAVWSLAVTPNPGGSSNLDENALFGVRCVSAGNCWAVGERRHKGGAPPNVNQILHWNGRMWSVT